MLQLRNETLSYLRHKRDVRDRAVVGEYVEPRFFSIGVITACFIDGGTTKDDREALMIWARTGDRESM